MPGMDMSRIWPHLAPPTQSWLIEHNGEPLPDAVVDEILTVTGGGSETRVGGPGTPMRARRS